MTFRVQRSTFNVLGGAFIASFLWAGPASANPVSPEGILRAQENLTYAGTLLINGKQRVKVMRGANHQQRQEFLDSKGALADLLLCDSKIRWHYTPEKHQVKVLPVEPESGLERRLILLKRNYRFEVMGQAERADRPVTLVRFFPLHPGNLAHLLWVDRQTGLPLAVERRETDGKLVDRSEFLQIRFNPAVGHGAFHFQIPDGCRVQSTLTVLAHGHGAPGALEGGFAPKAPRYLPGGYQLLTWQAFKGADQVPTFNWRFHDGLNSLSLFAVEARHQAPTPHEGRSVLLGTVPAFFSENGPSRLLMWRAQGAGYTLVGHLPEAEFEAIAKSTFEP